MYELFFKRILDLTLATLLLVILLPVNLLVAIIVIFDVGFPIIFKQERIGKNGKVFNIYKFRTMKNLISSDGKILSDNKRTTAIGKILRKLSMDEIPQLINIIKGDMSFIGPRPYITRYAKFYTEKENERHAVRPGLTGLSQINGRNLLDWNSRLNLDIQYVQNVTLKNDFIIFYKTIIKQFKPSEVVERDENLMLDFDDERKLQFQKNIYIKEISLDELKLNKKVFELYINDLLKMAKIQNKENEKQRIFENMIKYKEDETAIIQCAATKKTNEIIGFIWAYKHEKRIHVNYFYIKKAYRKKGIGNLLINKIYEIAQNQNIKEIELIVYPNNFNAITFYEKQGFQTERVQLCKRL